MVLIHRLWPFGPAARVQRPLQMQVAGNLQRPLARSNRPLSIACFSIFSSASIIGKFTVFSRHGPVARQLAQLRPSVLPESNQHRISCLQSKVS
jgi:hypothetical protein